MPTPDAKPSLEREWITLQNNYERYEIGAMAIKLTAVVLWVAAAAIAVNPWLLGVVTLILWLLEGIYKTYQSRLGERLLKVEGLLASDSDPQQAFQLHSHWQVQRRANAGLVAEYAVNAVRPTVAFPYAVLVLLCGALSVIG